MGDLIAMNANLQLLGQHDNNHKEPKLSTTPALLQALSTKHM